MSDPIGEPTVDTQRAAPMVAAPEPPAARACFACGYDVASLPAGAGRCPECGVELRGWAARWPLRLADLGATLAIWGIASGAGVWLVCMAATRFSAGGSQLAGRRTASEVLLVAPAAILAAGLVVLAGSGPAGWARRAAWAVAALLVAAAGVLAMRKLATPGDPAGAWLSATGLDNAARWAALALGPIAGGLLLAQAARVAGWVGLTRLGWWCGKGALWLAFAAIALLACMTVYGIVADQAQRALRATPGPVVMQTIPGRQGGPVSFFTRPATQPSPWHWTVGVQIGWILVNTALAAAIAAVWAALVVVRLRVRETLGARGRGALL